MSGSKADAHAKSVFLDALEIDSADARRSYVAERCGSDDTLRREVEDLLRHHSAACEFLQSPPDAIAAADEPAVTERSGSIIGPYKLLEQIGEGGFGVVFMAEQTQPVRRKVALKVLKPGMDTRQVVARFEVERQALAIMDHPNIAHVLDGGETASGRPYVVMELVRGIPIIDFCDQNNLPVRERLDLFVSVCQAVQHAHQKGIIHRDLKPSNVMVTLHDSSPVVKVIDFGIAKVTGQQLTEKTLFTNFTQMIGTPMYMSPEQAQLSGLDVDTRTDIYALGVLLYELLTGTTPFDTERLRAAALDEIRRIICEEEPPRPSVRMSTVRLAATTVSARYRDDPLRLRQLYRGDLDWIVMKCLEKDRNRRYETASGLAMDIHRYLRDEPVLACPPSPGYRFRKFARRNKIALAMTGVISAVLLLAVVVLAISNVWVRWERNEKTQALRDRESALASETAARLRETEALRQAKVNAEVAEEQRGLAQENLKKALAAVDQMVMRVGHERLRDVPLMEPVRRELLEDALRFYQGFMAQTGDDPEIRRLEAIARGRLGSMLRGHGQLEPAVQSLREAISRLEQLRREALLDTESRLALVDYHAQLGWALANLEQRGEAVEQHRRGLEELELLESEAPGARSFRSRLSAACTGLGTALRHVQVDATESEALFHRAIDLARAGATAPAELATARHALASLLIDMRRWPEAEAHLGQASEIWRQLMDANPADALPRNGAATSLAALGALFEQTARHSEAAVQYRSALAIYELLGAEFPMTPSYRALAASCHSALGRIEQDRARAAESLERALAIHSELAAEFPSVPAFQSTLSDSYLDTGRMLATAGRTREAEQSLGHAISIKLSLEEHAFNKLDYKQGLALAHIELGRTLAAAERHDEAEVQFRRALEICEKLEADFGGNPEYVADLARTQSLIASSLHRAGKFHEAMILAGLAIPHLERATAAYPDMTLHRVRLQRCHVMIGLARARLGRAREAEAAYRKAIDAGADEVGVWAHRAAAQLSLGDLDAYRRSCAHMLGSFNRNEQWTDANSIAWFCLLSPESGVDFARVVEVAERALEHRPFDAPDSYVHDSLNTLGAALYRAGRYTSAIDRLSQAIDAHAGGGDAFDALFLAMAHWKLGNKDEARQAYERAAKWIDQNRARFEQRKGHGEQLYRIQNEAAQLLELDDRERKN